MAQNAEGQGQTAEPVETPIDAEFEPAAGPAMRTPSARRGATFAFFFFIIAVISAVGGGLLGAQYVLRHSAVTAAAAQSDRIVALETALADLSAANAVLQTDLDAAAAALADPAPDSTAVEALARVDALIERVDLLRSDYSGADGRIASLEAQRAETGDPAAAAMIAARLDRLAEDVRDARSVADRALAQPQITREMFDAMGERLDAETVLRVERLAAQLEGEVAGLEALIERVNLRAAAAEDAAATLAARLAGVEDLQAGGRDAAAAAFALAELQEAANAGGAFTAQLEHARPSFNNTRALEELSTLAELGAPSRATLGGMFPAIAHEVRAAERGNGETGMLGQISGALAGAVSTRRVDNPDIRAPEEILVRAQARLEDDELNAAAEEMARLEGPAGEAARGWIMQARRRLAIEAALDALRDELSEM